MIYLLFTSFVFAFTYVVLLRKYSSLWTKIQEQPLRTIEDKICILIPFRNEAKNLIPLLESLERLNYSDESLEIVFINDHSEDNSVEIIESFGLNRNMRIIHLDKSEGKKAAIRRAWELTKCDIYVHTDADCKLPADWLKYLVSPFHNEKIKFVSGPVVFPKPNTFFERLIYIDFAALIAVGAAHIRWNMPLICNGANLAYRHKALNKVDLVNRHSSGDDVFLMQSISLQYPNAIEFVKHEAAMVLTKAPTNWKEFIQQRLRWASKNTAYSNTLNTGILIFTWLLNVLILCCFFTFSSIGAVIGLFVLMLKLYAELSFYERISNFFAIKNWISTSIIGQVLHIPYMALLPLLSKLKKFEWKGRKLK